MTWLWRALVNTSNLGNVVSRQRRGAIEQEVDPFSRLDAQRVADDEPASGHSIGGNEGHPLSGRAGPVIRWVILLRSAIIVTRHYTTRYETRSHVDRVQSKLPTFLDSIPLVLRVKWKIVAHISLSVIVAGTHPLNLAMQSACDHCSFGTHEPTGQVGQVRGTTEMQ